MILPKGLIFGSKAIRRIHCNFSPSPFIPVMILYFNLAEAEVTKRKEKKKTRNILVLKMTSLFSTSLCKCQMIHIWFSKCWLCCKKSRGQFQAPQGSIQIQTGAEFAGFFPAPLLYGYVVLVPC